MIRQPEREQLNRLNVKTLDQVFIARVRGGLGCSMFEAESLTELIKEVYFPWLSQPEAIQAGQLALTAVSADEPGHKPLSKCKMEPVVSTLYAGEEDHQYRLSHEPKGTVALRLLSPSGCRCFSTRRRPPAACSSPCRRRWKSSPRFSTGKGNPTGSSGASWRVRE